MVSVAIIYHAQSSKKVAINNLEMNGSSHVPIKLYKTKAEGEFYPRPDLESHLDPLHQVSKGWTRFISWKHNSFLITFLLPFLPPSHSFSPIAK
jgi:hypothetical protein